MRKTGCQELFEEGAALLGSADSSEPGCLTPFVGIGEGLPKGVDTQISVLETLAAWGLQVSPEHAFCADLDQAIAYHRGMLERRDSLDLEIDGTVIKDPGYPPE